MPEHELEKRCRVFREMIRLGALAESIRDRDQRYP